MQIDAVTADSDRIKKRSGINFLASLSGFLHPSVRAHVLLKDGEEGANPP